MADQKTVLFHKNFSFLWQKLDATYYQAKFGKTNNCTGGESLPSYAVLSKCQNDLEYLPSPHVLNKICNFFNENMVGGPPVDSWRFTHVDLSAYGDFCKKRGVRLDRRLEGVYWGFYTSSQVSGGTAGALFTIFEQEGILRANLVTGIHTDQQLYDPALEQLLRSAPVTQRNFFAYCKERTADRLYCFEGTVEASERSVLIAPLRSFNVPPQKLALMLDITDLPSNRISYLGGAAMILSTSDVLTARVYPMGLVNVQCCKDPARRLSLGQVSRLLELQTDGMDCRVNKLDKAWYELAFRLKEGFRPGQQNL